MSDNTEQKAKPTRTGPTDKMLAAAKRAADRHGVKLPKNAETEFEACRAFLDEYINLPSPKQIAYAQKISEDKGTKLPDELLKDARGISEWIDQNQ